MPFFIFKHSRAPKRSWKIFHGGPGKSWKSPGFFLSKRVGTLWILDMAKNSNPARTNRTRTRVLSRTEPEPRSKNFGFFRISSGYYYCCLQEGKSGYSLLHLAVKEEDAELFSYLLREPMVDVNRATYCRRTALDIADMLERYDMVRQLTAAGAQHSANYVPDSGSESDDVSRE